MNYFKVHLVSSREVDFEVLWMAIKVLAKWGMSGADPGFFKRGGAQIKDWQNFGTCGDRGVWGGCAPSEAEKNCNFQSQFARFGAYFLPEAPTQSQAPYLYKK